MTVESENALNAAITFEAKKNTLSQTQDGNWKINLVVQAIDMPDALTAALMGQRFQCVLVAIDTDETPIKIEIDKPNNNNISQAAMLVKDQNYWKFLEDQSNDRNFGILQECRGHVETAFKNIIGVKSKKEVASGQAARDFKLHVWDFNQWKKQIKF